MQATDPFQEIRILKSQRDALAEALKECCAALEQLDAEGMSTEGEREICQRGRTALATLEEQP